MKKSLTVLFSLVLIASGCIIKKNNEEVASYLDSVHNSMVELSENPDSYLQVRAFYNNGSIDPIEAYDNAVMAYMASQRIVEELNETTPPDKFERFHSLIVSSSEHFTAAYRQDMDCIKTEVNASCEMAKNEIQFARNTSYEAMGELESLGVNLY